MINISKYTPMIQVQFDGNDIIYETHYDYSFNLKYLIMYEILQTDGFNILQRDYVNGKYENELINIYDNRKNLQILQNEYFNSKLNQSQADCFTLEDKDLKNKYLLGYINLNYLFTDKITLNINTKYLIIKILIKYVNEQYVSRYNTTSCIYNSSFLYHNIKFIYDIPLKEESVIINNINELDYFLINNDVIYYKQDKIVKI